MSLPALNWVVLSHCAHPVVLRVCGFLSHLPPFYPLKTNLDICVILYPSLFSLTLFFSVPLLHSVPFITSNISPSILFLIKPISLQPLGCANALQSVFIN